MIRLQEWIYTIEEGRGARLIRFAAVTLAFLVLAGIYNFRAYKNFATVEAMDAAQLARNISDGDGFTTDFIRPFSIYLLREHNDGKTVTLNNDHPDLANAPLYPTFLASFLMAAPAKYTIPPRSGSPRYQPELLITLLNQLLFFVATLILFNLTARLFDGGVAWVAVLLFIGTELMWRFSVSGLSTMLLINLILALAWCLVRLDVEQKSEFVNSQKVILWGIAVGVLIGLAALTRYSFIFLILPAVLFAVMLQPRFRISVAVSMLIPFLLLISPWIARNFIVSGTPFGVAGYSLLETTTPLPEDLLQRSINPEPALNKIELRDVGRKIVVNSRSILQNDLPKLGGNWVAAFFVVGLLIRFKNPTLSRMRWFTVAAVFLFVVVQAGGRTNLTDASPEINSENLLVVFAPLVFVFGTGIFFLLVDQLDLQFLAVRRAIITFFLAVLCLPLALSLLQKQNPFAYPPYFPPLVQQIASINQRDDLIMTDIPWATAWYGDRQSVQLSLNYDEDFLAIHQKVKPVNTLYFSPTMMNNRLLMDMLRPSLRNQKPWARFVWEAIGRGQVPDGFPLKKSWLEILPDHLLLADYERWKGPAGQ